MNKKKPDYVACPALQRDEIINIFSHIELFAGIAKEKGIINVAEKSKIVICQENVELMKIGALGTEIFIMLDGEVEVLSKSISGDNFVIAVLTADTRKNIYPMVGEFTILAPNKRSATVRTRTTTKLMVIQTADFLKAINTHPAIGLHVYRSMCKTIQQQLERANKNVATLFEAYTDELVPQELSDHPNSF